MKPAILDIMVKSGHPLALLTLCSPVSTRDLVPFTTDGCSAFPNGTLEQQSLWVGCSIRHELAYWKGGMYSERPAADRALEACIAQVGAPECAALMLAGMRGGGAPFYPMPYHRGNGLFLACYGRSVTGR